MATLCTLLLQLEACPFTSYPPQALYMLGASQVNACSIVLAPIARGRVAQGTSAGHVS